MSHYLNVVTTNATNFAAWTHQTIKELPVAGAAYNKFNEYVSRPLWNAGCRAQQIAAPYFQDARAVVEPQVRKHPYIAAAVAGTMAVIVFHRVINYYFPTKRID